MNNPIDWSALILSILRTRGWTQVQLAERIGAKPTTLSAWLIRGVEPRYSDGVALVRLSKVIDE